MTRSRSLPLRVGIDLRLAGYRGGGIARYASELHRALGSVEGITPVALRSRKDSTARAGDVRLATPPHHRAESIAIPVELALRRAALDVYHATDFIAPRLPRVPIIATVHDLAFVTWPGDLTADALRYYRQLASSRHRTAAWITPSAWTADQLAELYEIERTRIHVVPHGVSLDLLQTPPRSRSARGTFVLAVGTIEPRKRYDLLLDAVSHDRHSPYLIVVGQPGWNSSAVQDRLRSMPNVTWLPSVDDETLAGLYRDAIALVVTARVEGFGLPALEAMACGTPVLSSGGGALPEVTGDAALHAEDQTPEAWRAAIREIAEDSDLWMSLSAAGRSRASEFSWERAARDTAIVYRTVRG